MTDLTGSTIENRYEFDICLGEGSFAKVYRVHDTRRNVDLAAKVLRTDIADESNVIERFRRESEVLAKLQHPNIVRYYDLIETDNLAFILMDYIPGDTLQATMYHMGRPLSVQEMFRHLKPLTAALHFAHGEGVIHRDLKPANILIHTNGQLLVSDFGIAHVLDDVTVSRSLGSLGTPLYMAPEQILNVEVSPATDVYALGVILFQMLTGTVPFAGKHPATEGSTASERIAYEQLHFSPPAPRNIEASIPLAVEEVILRCLSKSPLMRPLSVRSVYDELAEAIGAEPSDLTPLPVEQPPSPPLELSPPEMSQFVKYSTKEGGQPEPEATLDTSGYHRSTTPEEEETSETIYPEYVLEGKGRPTIENSKSPYIPQNLPPDQVSIMKPTPPGVVIPKFPTQANQTQQYTPKRESDWNLTALMVVGIFLVMASCVALMAYTFGVFENEPQPSNFESIDSGAIPTVTPNQAAPSESVDVIETVIPTEVSNGGLQDPFNSGLIAYASDRSNSNYDLYVTDPMANLGSRLQLTDTSDLNERSPAWSPDGTQIAFHGYVGDINNGSDVYIMDANGENVQNLTNSPDEDDLYPAWSPDGTKIAFHSNRRTSDSDDDLRDFEIYIYDLLTGEITQLTNNETPDFGPDWSPDGTKLAFHTFHNETSQFRVVTLDIATGEFTYLTPPTLDARFPAWSPDGSILAFHVRDDPAADNSFTQIYLINADGTTLRPLMQVAVNDFFPDWSPDGSQIIFHRLTADGIYGIFRYFFATGTVQPIGNQLRDFFPDWYANIETSN